METEFSLDESLLEFEGTLSCEVENNIHTSVEVFNKTDLGNAKRLVAQHGNKIRYCFAWKKWLVWNGKNWHIDNDGQILRLAKDTVKNIYNEAAKIQDETQRKSIAKWAVLSESEHRLRAMVSLAESEPGVSISPQELSTHHYLLNCLNGTIDLQTGQLKRHNPRDFITGIIQVEYNPNATCPRWVNFLETIFNFNHGIIQYVQRIIGYSLTGDISEQCLFLLHGTGCNGKSTLLSCLFMLMGDYAQTADFESFLIQKNNSVRNDLARMAGKRFISAVEAGCERRLSEVLTKQLTGGDTISARFLYGEYFEFRPTFKIWLAANHKPNIRGTDYAIWRRIRLIPFEVTISEDKRDHKLLEILLDELPGILAWAVQGCLEWQKNGLQTPDKVKQATNSYKNEMDSVGVFLSECCVLIPDAKVQAGILYEIYKKWCEQNGEYVLNQKCFGTLLSDRGFQRKQSSGRWWLGIGIRENSTD